MPILAITAATSVNCSASGEERRHTSPTRRAGAGAARRATDTAAERVSTESAISGKSVTPIPAPTICVSVASDDPSITVRGVTPPTLQNSSA